MPSDIHTSNSHITFAFARWRRVQLPGTSQSQAVRPSARRVWGRGRARDSPGAAQRWLGPGPGPEPGRGARAGLTGSGRGGLRPRGVAPGSPGAG